jgi:hypothetical protein
VPPALIVATDVLLLLHTPPLTVLVSAVVAVLHMLDEPEMAPAFGRALTVIAVSAISVPQPFVTV